MSSSLVFDTAASSVDPTLSPPPLTGPIPTSTPPTTQRTTLTVPSSSDVPHATDAASQSAVATSSNIPLGAVIGAAIGSVALLSLVLLFVLWHSRRARRMTLQSYRNRQHRKSQLETWNRLGSISGSIHHIPSTKEESFANPAPMISPLSFQYPRPPPPNQLNQQDHRPQHEQPSFDLSSHPYSNSLGAEQDKATLSEHNQPPAHIRESASVDDASFYSTVSSNTIQKIAASHATADETSANPFADPGLKPLSPLFTPHPSAQGEHVTERWGSVGKERNVEHFHPPSAGTPTSASSGTVGAHSKMESLIAALELDSNSANKSLEGRLSYVSEHDDTLDASIFMASPSAFPKPPR